MALLYARLQPSHLFFFLFFFFNDTATTEIYTLSLHDALPISPPSPPRPTAPARWTPGSTTTWASRPRDRKSTRLNYSHANLVCRLLLENKNTSVDRLECRPHKKDTQGNGEQNTTKK